MNIHKLSPAEKRRDNTTYVRDIKTGDVICTFNGWFHAFEEVDRVCDLSKPGDCWSRESIKTGPYEGVEYIAVLGEPVAWIDEGPGERYLTDEIHEALFPMRQAAE
jgi:hypothetical protein